MAAALETLRWSPPDNWQEALGWLPRSWSVPGCSAAGLGAGKVPFAPLGARRAGGGMCQVMAQVCVQGSGGVMLAPNSPPAHAWTSWKHKQELGHLWCLGLPEALVYRCWCHPKVIISPSLATLVFRQLPSSAMSLSKYGLPAPLIWVIRVYVLIGVNTKTGVTGIHFQVHLRKMP